MLKLSTKTTLVFEDEKGNFYEFNLQKPDLSNVTDQIRAELCLKAGVAYGTALQAVQNADHLLEEK